MNRIEQSIKADIPLETSLDMIMDSIKRATPCHQATVLIRSSEFEKISSRREFFHPLSEPLHPLIRKIFDTGNHIYIEDTNLAPSWQGMEFIGKTRVWIGLPIVSGRDFNSILSLSRATSTPFNKNEIDMAKTFSEFLSIAVNRTTGDIDESQFVNMLKRKFIS